MKLNELKRKNIIFISIILVALFFLSFKLDSVYVWLKDNQSGGLESSSIRSEYSRIKSECVGKAVRWLNKLSVDPLELKKKGMKGKKHFVEKLFIFYQLYLHTNDLEKKEMYRKVLEQMFKMAKSDSYHLIEDDEVLFKSAIVSYVHACCLMEQLGFNVQNYKRNVRELLPRIERHMPTRNASVQMLLVYCLRVLGFETKYSIERILKNTLSYNLEALGDINIFDLKYNSYMLGVCHEIFVISEYGGKKIDLLTKEKKDYLKDTLKSSIKKILSSGDLRYLDLLAEMLVSLKYLNCENLPEYRKGIHFIINHQNKNGSFGDYEKFRAYFAQKSVDIDIKWYLHTTAVCLWALLIESY